MDGRISSGISFWLNSFDINRYDIIGIETRPDDMELFSADGRKLAVRLQKEYMNRLEEEHSIENPQDYLRFLDNIGGLEIEEEVWNHLSENDISRNAFFQITPYNNQKVMYCSLNPGLKSVTTEGLRSGQLADHDNTHGNVDQLALQTMMHFGSYLNSGGPEKIVRAMRENLDHLPDKGKPDHIDFVDVNDLSDFQGSYFDYVNHTRYFKLRSPDRGFVDEFDKNYWRSRFVDELKISNPDLFICGCVDAWKSIYDMVVDDPATEIIPHRDSIVSRKYTRNTEAVPGVFEIPSEELWVVTIFHEKYSPNIYEFKQNLSYVNNKLS